MVSFTVEQDDILLVVLKVQENSSVMSLFRNHDPVTQDKLKLITCGTRRQREIPPTP